MGSHLEDTKYYAEQNPRPNTPLLAAGDSAGDGQGDEIQPSKNNGIPSDGGAAEKNRIQRSGAGRPKRHRDPDRYYTINISSCTKRELEEHKTRLTWELEQVRNMTRWVGGSSVGNQSRLPPKKKAKKTEDQRSESEKGLDAMMRKCLEIVNKLMKQRGASWFNAPVDVIGLGLYDYHQIIKIPMDLGTVKVNLIRRLYQYPTEFAADVKLTFDNAMLYNPPGHVVHGLAKQLMVKFERMYYPAYEVFKKRTGLEEVRRRRRAMTAEERNSLRARLEGLGMEEMADVVTMLRKRDVELRANGDEIVLEFEDLDNDTLWALDHFLNIGEQSKPTNDIIINVKNNINDPRDKNNDTKNNNGNYSDKLEIVEKGEVREEGAKSEKESSGGSSSSGSSSSSSSSSDSDSNSESESGRSLVTDPVQQTKRSQV